MDFQADWTTTFQQHQMRAKSNEHSSYIYNPRRSTIPVGAFRLILCIGNISEAAGST